MGNQKKTGAAARHAIGRASVPDHDAAVTIYRLLWVLTISCPVASLSIIDVRPTPGFLERCVPSPLAGALLDRQLQALFADQPFARWMLTQRHRIGPRPRLGVFPRQTSAYRLSRFASPAGAPPDVVPGVADVPRHPDVIPLYQSSCSGSGWARLHRPGADLYVTGHSVLVWMMKDISTPSERAESRR